ncbi:MAG: glycosyltransferase [Chromatiales bacterium]|nr:glycosyltransferase [Chromatiales bacterium]
MGIERLLWLLRAPLQTHRDWRVVCVAREEHGKTDWDHLEYLADLLRALRIEGRLILSQTQGQTTEWYQRASIYATGASQPGAAEALIDAKAHGLPVLGYDQACVLSDLVNHQIDGYLIEDEDSAVAAAAARLIEDQELRERMGEASRADAHARFSPEAVRRQWLEIHRISLLSTCGHRRLELLAPLCWIRSLPAKTQCLGDEL